LISGLTQEQFRNLPATSLHYPCDRCKTEGRYGYLMRDIHDYRLEDGDIIEKEQYTALYLCDGCHWTISCEHGSMKRRQTEQREIIKSNEARWLQKVSHLSTQEIAERVGVSRQACHKWIKGKAITPEHRAQLKKIIEAYITEEDEW
jgi:hypothetical protein